MDRRTIHNAVQRSREFNELVRCTVTDGSHLEAFLAQVAGDNYGFSQENRDEYGREVLDVYGDDWRIRVTIDAEGATA